MSASRWTWSSGRLRPFAAAITAAACILLALAAAPQRAHAGTEEWSTFDPEAEELDDESTIDHILNRPQPQWRDTWEHSSRAFRTSQGCLTAGVWYIQSELKLDTPLGRRAEFGLYYRQNETDAESFNYADFRLRYHTRWGTPGGWFRPLKDKSRQDFALTWAAGSDTSAEQLELAFSLEDVFNNLWAFRQTQVGGLSEPYKRRPYEPGIRWVSRHDHLRAEVSGRWLTPSRKRVIDYNKPDPDRVVTLWGTLAEGSLELRTGVWLWRLATANQQARSTDAPLDNSAGNALNFRRRWSAEAAVGRPIVPALTAELRVLYQDRDARRDPPIGPTEFGALDRVAMLSLHWQARPTLGVKVGGMFDRVNVGEQGPYRPHSDGTRNESRGFVGLDLRFGNVTFSGYEGIELDPERYPVWHHHDKGFLSMQAKF